MLSYMHSLAKKYNICYIFSMSQRINKEMIIDAAFEIMTENGFKAVNTRDIAAKLQVSTQPIYSSYKSVGEMLEDLYEKAVSEFKKMLFKDIDKSDFLYSFSLVYIRTAKEHSNLFKFIFFEYYKENLSRENIYSLLLEYLENDGNFGSVLTLYKIDADGMKSVFRRLLTYVHGEAAYIISEKGNFENFENETVVSDLRNTINEMLRGEIVRRSFEL